MAMNISNIPPNAVEMLFVEDLMQWLLRRQVGRHYTSGKVGPYRDLIFSVFNDDVRKAVNFFDMSLEGEIQDDFSDIEELTQMSFIEYAFRCEEIYFKNGFLADDFLKYCVRLVSMAINFSVFNVPEALNITFHNILKLLENRTLLRGRWDAVIKVARNYAKIYDDSQNVVTPDTSEDELSEDVPQADRSANNLDVNKEIPARDLSSAKEGLHAEGTPKPATNADFNTGQKL